MLSWRTRLAHSTTSVTDTEPSEQLKNPFPTVCGLARTYLVILQDKIQSSDVTTHSPLLPWTIRHAAWVPTRCNVRRDTRMTPHEKIRGKKCRKEIFPLAWTSSRSSTRSDCQSAFAAMGHRLGRDTLSDEHLIGTAAGVLRSRAGPPSPRTSPTGTRSVESKRSSHRGHHI